MSNDKIDQDVKIFQAVIKEAVSQGFEGGINLVNIGQVRINTREGGALSSLTTSSKKEVLRLPPVTSKRAIKASTEMCEDLKILMDKLSKPRFESLIKLAFVTSHKYCTSVHDAADWLNVKESFVYHWYQKLGLSTKTKGGST